jgi:hypothetical protein
VPARPREAFRSSIVFSHFASDNTTMSAKDSTLASELSESQPLPTLIQLPPSFVNTLVSTGNLGDKKSIAQDVS